MYGERRDAYRILARKPDGKRPLGRPRRGWWAKSKIYFKEVVWQGEGWIDLAEGKDKWRAVVNVAMNLGIP
jgi:sensor domain CHASE-containing protein